MNIIHHLLRNRQRGTANFSYGSLFLLTTLNLRCSLSVFWAFLSHSILTDLNVAAQYFNINSFSNFLSTVWVACDGYRC